jgi:hypothetical protein
MTDDEIAAMRQRVRDWQAEVSATPANLLALYERIVESCLGMVTEGATLADDTGDA